MNLRAFSTALLLVVVAALWTCAAASATVVITAGDTVHTGTIKAESQGAITWDGTVSVTCNKSSFEGTIESDGPEGPAEGKLSSLAFSECGNHTVTVVKPGTFKLNATSEGNGTFESSGAEITLLTHSLFLGTRHCIYTTNETELGTVTGTYTTLDYAKLDIGPASLPPSTDTLCGSEAELTGSYAFTSPVGLVLETEAAPSQLEVTKELHFKATETKPVVMKNLSIAFDIKGVKVEWGVNSGVYFTKAGTCGGELKAAKSCSENVTCKAGVENQIRLIFVTSTDPKETKWTRLYC